MKYSLTCKHVELTEGDRELLDEKLNRLKKHLRPPFQLDVVLTHDTRHRHGDVLTCRLTLEMAGRVWHAERVAPTVQTALDEALEALRKELRRHHDKGKKHRFSWRRLLG